MLYLKLQWTTVRRSALCGCCCYSLTLFSSVKQNRTATEDEGPPAADSDRVVEHSVRLLRSLYMLPSSVTVVLLSGLSDPVRGKIIDLTGKRFRPYLI